MLAADDVPCVECGLIPSDCRPERIVEAMPEWAAATARGIGTLAVAATPLAIVATMTLCLAMGVPGRFGDATDPGHPLRQPMNEAVALMSGGIVALSLLAGSLTIRLGARRAPPIQPIRWVGRLSLIGLLAAGVCGASAAIAWIPVWGLPRDVTGPAEAIAALSLLLALGAVVGYVGRVGAMVGAPWMKASRRTLRISWFAAIVCAALLPLGEYGQSDPRQVQRSGRCPRSFWPHPSWRCSHGSQRCGQSRVTSTRGSARSGAHRPSVQRCLPRASRAS